jgi:hypothetical protein
MTKMSRNEATNDAVRSHPARGPRIALVALTLAGALALGGCREAEQDRPLTYEPGTYLGQEDESLSAETLDTLRERGRQGQQM